MLRGARRSHIADVARAAAKWESGIACFIKVRLTHQRPRRIPRHTGYIEVDARPIPPPISLPHASRITHHQTQTQTH
jgi:hypothetical protein